MKYQNLKIPCLNRNHPQNSDFESDSEIDKKFMAELMTKGRIRFSESSRRKKNKRQSRVGGGGGGLRLRRQ